MGVLIRFALIGLLVWLWATSLVHAARTRRWGWFVAMILLWPTFVAYVVQHYEAPWRTRVQQETLAKRVAKAREVHDLGREARSEE